MIDTMELLARHVLFPLQARWEGNSVGRHLAALERSQWLPPDEIAALQLRKLTRLVDHAYAASPFYRERLGAVGFRPGDLTSREQLMALPVVTKADIRNHREAMLTGDHPVASLAADKTGGSTGQPLHFHRTWDRSWSRAAAAIRHDRWVGWEIGRKAAYVWGHRGDLAGAGSLRKRLRRTFLERRIILDTSTLTGERFAGFRRTLLAYRPCVYIGYANSVFLYARFLEETGGDYHRPEAIITSAEVLDPDRRAVIERVFGCRVFDRYGSRETGVIASECEAHEGLHMCAENLLVEMVKGGGPAAPGERGRVLVTDLENPAMPFIRYEIGDVATPMAPGVCACGRGLPRLEVAAGRVTDFLVTPEGGIISGASLTIYLIANAPGVAQAQLVQDDPARLLIRVVPGEGYGSATLDFFAEQIPRFFGPRVTWDVEPVTEIPCEASGKYRFSVSSIDPATMF